MLQTNTLPRGKKSFCAIAQNALFLLYYSDERFSAGDERIGKNVFCAIAQNALFLLQYSDECFSAGDERIERVRSNFHPTHATHVANSDFEAELISKLLHRHSPWQTGGSHALVLG